MCTAMDLPTSILASLFALMFAGLPYHFPLLTMDRRIKELGTAKDNSFFNCSLERDTPR